MVSAGKAQLSNMDAHLVLSSPMFAGHDSHAQNELGTAVTVTVVSIGKLP
jgi:hypothetical protein